MHGFHASPLSDEGNLSYEVGGYIKFDGIFDFNEIGSRDSFLVPTIPVGSGSSPRTTFHARQTRLFVDVTSASPIGDINGRIEGDFFGAGNSLRLRHAYVQHGPWLVGQTWSNFVNLHSHPAVLDFEGPAGMVFSRSAQIRYRQSLSDALTMSLALEDAPSRTGFIGGGENLERLPDFVGNVCYQNDIGNLQLGGVLREVGFRPASGLGAGIDQYELGGGMSISGQVNVSELSGLGTKDHLRFQYAYGQGIGSYFENLNFSGIQADGGANLNGTLEVLPVYGWYVSYEHWWTDILRSHAIYGTVRVDNSSGQPADALRRTQYIAVNTILSPVDQLDLGIEYLFGRFTNDASQSGEAHRLQFSAIWRF